MENQETNVKVLNGWKEIAQHLSRGVRTVQRWELELGLPIRRPRGKSRSAVVAVAAELDAWLATAPFGKGSMDTNRLNDSQQVPIKVLVVEDSVSDLNTCIGVLQRLGVAQVDVMSNIPAALLRLSEILDGKAAKPDLMLLDLGFSVDSGFDVLRYWKSNPCLRSIRVIVWTVLEQREHEFCNAFGVEKVIPKWAGTRELEQALRTHPDRLLYQ
ncbi:MAG: response regulator [Candidatus Angelobacter sp.]